MSRKIKVLFLAVNSSHENRGRVEQEAREIQNTIKLGRYKDSVELITRWAVRPRDLQEALLENQPDIVHFSGRGLEGAGVVFEDDNANAGAVDVKVLAELFRILKDNIRVVVFNACFSGPQAAELTNLIDYSIGMSSAVDDDAAISFAAAFYQALVYARTVSEAFDLARLELKIEDKPGFAAPVLSIGPSVDITKPFLGPEEVQPANELRAVERYARLARQGLEPHILPRISRRVVREKYLPAILRATSNRRERIIPIIGPAGYGKSTVLGDIYDELMKTDVGWVGLVRCNDLVIDTSKSSVEQFSRAIGEGASGTSQSISEIARTLTASYGAGVLLIDTLDLVLNVHLVPALRGTLIQLMDSRSTIVFTCRGYEYSAFLEPVSEKFAGVVEKIDRYQIPHFAREEIEEATLGFINSSSKIKLKDRGQLFAKSVLDLSSDNRSLREIVSNPLLLAMLCDLFGGEGLIPDDLTVSRLYSQYWEEKITKSRKYGPQSTEAILKRRLCLDIAKMLFEISHEHLQDVVYESDLELLAGETLTTQYAELLSEGVLKAQSLGRISFFHQTFLEYAIARWLATRSGKEQRELLLDSLRETGFAGTHLHWWPVVRQLLTVVDATEFDRLVARLDLSNFGAFRAVAYAAASHPDAVQIRKLLPQAFELGDEYQDILRNAIELAPEPLAEAVWQVTIDLVEQSRWRTAVKAAQTAGTLVARRGRILGGRTLEVLNAIERRALNTEVSKHDRDTSLNLIGWFLSAILRTVEYGISSQVLHALQVYYPKLSDAHRATVIRLHLVPGASEDEQKALLKMVVEEPAPRRLKEELSDLLEHRLLDLIGSPAAIFGATLIDALHALRPIGWDMIQARAVGRHLESNQLMLEAVVSDLFQGDQNRISRNQIAIVEAIRHGGARAVFASLTSVPVEMIPAERIGVLIFIVQNLAVLKNPSAREELVEWTRPLLQAHPEKLIAAFVNSGNVSPSLSHFLIQLLSKLPKNQRAKISRRIMRQLSSVTGSSIAEELETQLLSDLPNIPSELALVELYGLRAKGSVEELTKLIRLSLGESERIAKAASSNIVKAVAELEKVNATDILLLTQSRIVGVRNNCLQALMGMIDGASPLDAQDIANAYAALENENQESVLQNLCQLTSLWVRARSSCPAIVALSFEKFARRLINDQIAGSGTVRSLIITLKTIVQTEDPSLPREISNVTNTILKSKNLDKIRDGESETVDLLSAIARLDPSFLPMVVDDFTTLPWRNARAVASAVKRVDGAGSPLLDRMLADDRCAPEVKNFILELRGF